MMRLKAQSEAFSFLPFGDSAAFCLGFIFPLPQHPTLAWPPPLSFTLEPHLPGCASRYLICTWRLPSRKVEFEFVR